MVGDQVWLVVLVWLAAEHSSPGVAGLVIGAASIPRALLLVVAGAYVDRHDPVRLALVSDVGRAGVFVLAAIVAALGGSSGSPPLLAGVGLAVGVGDAFFFPASAALRPRLLKPAQLTSGTASYELASRTAMLIGPPLGGLMLGAPVWAVFLLNASSFGFSAACFARLRTPGRAFPPAPAPARRPAAAMTLDGMRYLWQDVQLRTLVVTLLVFNVALAGALDLGGVLVVRERGLEPVALSTLFASFAAGAIGTAMVMGRVGHGSKPLSTIGLAAFAQAATIVGIGYSATTLTLGACGFLAGGSSSVLGITASAHVQARTADEFRGRVNSLTALANYGLVPISLGLTGVMAATWGTGRALVTLALAQAVAAATCLEVDRRSGRDR